ncbi:MAG: MFS transporter [Ardenticatenaceae bacterium]|nr:MFS transporter [Ardenticatenaceae bacterium]HBY97570.1 hypothetical protein [Chloroflexota bacterium]
MIRVLHNSLFISIVSGHFFVDILNSAFPIIMAALALQMGLSNAQLGLAATIYAIVGSLTQPLFGYAADRWGSRLFAVGGIFWMATFFAVAGLLPGWSGLILLLFAGLGSAAFHPQAAMNARYAAEPAVASGTSVFFLFGQAGLAIGPGLAGVMIAQLGLKSTLLTLAALMIPAALLLSIFMPTQHYAPPSKQQQATTPSRAAHWPILAIVAFLLLLALRSWPISAITTFFPKLLGDLGFAPQEFGLSLTAFMMGAAVGGVAAGWLADHWRRRVVVFLSLALAPVPLWALLTVDPRSPLLLLTAAGAGFLIGAPHSILVLLAQSMMPHRMALASGLVLGFMFTAGALGTYATGFLADQIGLQGALGMLPALVIGAALCSAMLPTTKTLTAATVISSEAVPAD